MPKLTYLQLVQRLALDVSETAPSLTTTVGLTGRLLRCANAIAWSWVEIQNLHKDWKFLRTATSFTTDTSKTSYTTAEANVATDTFGRWLLDTFRVYPTAAGSGAEVPLSPISYDGWRDTYNIGAMRSVRTQPSRIGVVPSTNALVLGPIAATGYTVLGDFYRNAQLLAADGDYPILPIQHDPLIIMFYAMKKYSTYLGAPELYQMGSDEFTTRYDDLKSEQLPKIRWG